MSHHLTNSLVIGISSRALFDLSHEHRIFAQEGLSAYASYQRQHEETVLPQGAAFPLVSALLGLNALSGSHRIIEVIIMSRNSAETSLRIFNSIRHYGLDISRAALSGGSSLASYLQAFQVDLFLSAAEDDVQAAVNSGTAAALIYDFRGPVSAPLNQIRIAFDGDAVLFSDESERIFQTQGLEAFVEHERINACRPMAEGPFARLLKTISYLQHEFSHEPQPIRTALVTARCSPAHERVIRTLRAWNVRIDEAFFLGGIHKTEILRAFGAHIFFDDQDVHCCAAAQAVPAARVPYKTA